MHTYLQEIQTKCNTNPNNMQTQNYTYNSQQVLITETCQVKATGTNVGANIKIFKHFHSISLFQSVVLHI